MALLTSNLVSFDSISLLLRVPSKNSRTFVLQLSPKNSLFWLVYCSVLKDRFFLVRTAHSRRLTIIPSMGFLVNGFFKKTLRFFKKFV